MLGSRSVRLCAGTRTLLDKPLRKGQHCTAYTSTQPLPLCVRSNASYTTHQTLPSHTVTRPLPLFRIDSSQSHRTTTNSLRHRRIPPSRKHFHSTPGIQSQRKPKYDFRLAAAYSAKGEKFHAPKHHYDHSSPDQASFVEALDSRRQGPRDKRIGRAASGQDAFFVSAINNTGGIAFGVADGVGGWQDQGVNPAAFSHGLCEYMALCASAVSEEHGEKLRAQDLLEVGFRMVERDDKILAGGSTACIATAAPNGRLNIANLGDSGFVLFRLNAINHYSNPQTHAFNTPYQLSKMPPMLRLQEELFGKSQYGEQPKVAHNTNLEAKHGDVLILATDGMWDNISKEDVLHIVSRIMVGSKAWKMTSDGIRIGAKLPQLVETGGMDEESLSQKVGVKENNVYSLQAALAIGLAQEAKAASVNRVRNGPFAKEVNKYYPNEKWRGGKEDDICIVVAVVVEQQQ